MRAKIKTTEIQVQSTTILRKFFEAEKSVGKTAPTRLDDESHDIILHKVAKFLALPKNAQEVRARAIIERGLEFFSEHFGL